MNSIIQAIPITVACLCVMGIGYIFYSNDVAGRESFCVKHDMTFQSSRCVDSEGNKYMIGTERVLIKE